MTNNFDSFIFDLDGTLLDTLPDLIFTTNKVLRDAGFPEKSEREILGFIGSGLRNLLRQVLPETAGEAEVEKMLRAWVTQYAHGGSALTGEYPGMTATLQALLRQDKRLAVLSNKHNQGVRENIAEFFPGLFLAAYGECEFIPRKPDPAGLLFVMEEIGATPATCAYVGDSPVDLLTAQRCGVFAIGASWGYHSERELREAGADAIVSTPGELLAFA